MLKEKIKIEIRPIPNRERIKQFSEKLQYFSQYHTLCPFVNPKTLRYKTGLSDDDKKYLKDLGFPYDLNENYTPGIAHPFWESRIIKTNLSYSPVFLHPYQSPIDFIKWKYLLVSDYVYKSKKEMEKRIKPHATHYMYNEEEENIVEANKIEKRNKLINEIGKLSLKRKREIVFIIDGDVTDNKNEDYLTVRLESIMKEKTIELEKILEDKEEDVNLFAEIKMAIYKNILRKTKKGIFYFETNLGYAIKDVKNFLTKPENQEILIQIKSKL